jgi:hypothetical protein
MCLHSHTLRWSTLHKLKLGVPKTSTVNVSSVTKCVSMDFNVLIPTYYNKIL